MKFLNSLSRKILLTSFFITISLNLLFVKSIHESEFTTLNKIEGEALSYRNHYKKSKSQLRSEANPPISNTTNLTIGTTFNSFVNKSASNVDLRTFKQSNQNSKFHLLFDKQLEEIFYIFKNNKMAGISDFRSSYNVFVTNFNKCDQDKDLLLNLAEFTSCMTTDPYLSLIQAPDKLYSTHPNYITNATSFAANLFLFSDNYDKRGLNFYDYVIMRLMAFAWRKCSVNGPFIDEASFECAIDIISGSKSLHTNSLRKLYNLALELVNSKGLAVRTLDFATYYAFASSIRLYGKINSREDMDASQNEFDMALDSNILPIRFSQNVINDLFRLVKSSSSSKSGIDLYSFCFYDFFLKIFYRGFQGEKRWQISLNELNTIANLPLFPSYITNYLSQVPQANYTVDSYNLRAHINPGLLNEDDSLGKFLEIRSGALRYNNTAYYQPLVLKRIFTLLDSNEDGYLNFYDFANFIQVFYLYNSVDVKHADRVLVGNIQSAFTEHSDFPTISEEFREKAKRFTLLDQDLYIDPFYALAIIRMDDYVSHFLRKSDPTTVKELELNLIFDKINLKNFPSQYLDKCKRGNDDDGIPKFDWECSIAKAISRALVYLEHTRDVNDIKSHGFNLTYTSIDIAPGN